MNSTGGFTGNLSPSAVKTALDGVMYERFSREEVPQYLRASDPLFFKQGSLDKLSFIWEVDSGIGPFEKTAEQEDIKPSDTWIGNQKAKASQKYTKDIPISDEAFRADQVGKRAQIGRQIGDRAKVAQDSNAILDTYGDAFAGSVNTCPDGVALASNSHLSLKGFTIDTLETGALTPDNMWICVNSLAQQKANDGEAGGYLVNGVLVPFLLYKKAKEVLNSTLVADSGENNLNIFDTDFGSIQIRASIYLNSQYNSATNASTSYHLISEDHMITRKIFYDLRTEELVPPRFALNDTWMSRSKFHETAFPGDFSGYVGSNGSTA